MKNDKNYSIDTMDFVIIIAMIGGFWKGIWAPFIFFTFFTVVAAFLSGKSEKHDVNNLK